MKRILFVVETNYQLMYASILNYYLKEKLCNTAIINLLNSGNISHDNSCFDKIINFDNSKISNNGLKNIINEYTFIKDNINDIEDFKCDTLMVFKDSNFLQGFLINHLKKKFNVKTILLEEGLSIYRDDVLPYKNIKFITKYFIRRIILMLLGAKDAKFGFGYNKKIDLIAAYFPNQINVQKVKNKSLLSLPQLPPNTEVFSRLNKIFGFEGNNILSSDERIIFLGQPLSEMDICSNEEEQLFLKKLDDLARSKKLIILVKPHPKEKENKYKGFENFLVISNNIVPAELIVNWYQPNMLLTWYSSAGSVANTWWGIKTLYLFRLVNLNIENNYLSKVDVVETYNDLESQLSSELVINNKLYEIDESKIYEKYTNLISGFNNYSQDL